MHVSNVRRVEKRIDQKSACFRDLFVVSQDSWAACARTVDCSEESSGKRSSALITLRYPILINPFNHQKTLRLYNPFVDSGELPLYSSSRILRFSTASVTETSSFKIVVRVKTEEMGRGA